MVDRHADEEDKFGFGFVDADRPPSPKRPESRQRENYFASAGKQQSRPESRQSNDSEEVSMLASVSVCVCG